MCALEGHEYVYEGEWHDGRRHGEGTLTLPNGDTLTGQWEDGRLAGPVDFQFAASNPWANPDF